MERNNLSLNAWAKAAGLSEGGVRKFLDGTNRSLTDETYEKLAEAADVSAAVLRGERPPPERIELAGYVGAGAEVIAIDDHEKGAGLDDVQPPPGVRPPVLAVMVRGDSMYPAYRDGDVIIYTRESADDWRRFLGRDVVVRLKDGRTFVKVLKRTTATTATLGSHNAPDIENARIDWAAPVLWVKRGR